ncbi:IPT/TIG domain-containing protein, partial [Agarivorans albus]
DSVIIRSLPLNAAFARGIKLQDKALMLALAERGVGQIDVSLDTKAYLVDTISLPHKLPALDVATVKADQRGTVYSVVAGNYDFDQQRLMSPEFSELGGFYLLENNSLQGTKVLSSLDIPASRVFIQNSHAYLAAGDSGMVVIDISDLANPQVVSRVSNVGHVYDISMSGDFVYAVTEDSGVVVVDVTNPISPIVINSFANSGDARTLVTTPYSVISAGNGWIEAAPDVVLKLNSIDPSSGVVELSSVAEANIRLRFNKAIDLTDNNQQYFRLVDSQDKPVPFDIDIVNNDALIQLTSPEQLNTGDVITLSVLKGLTAAKPIIVGGVTSSITLYELKQSISRQLLISQSTVDPIELYAVVPNHISAGTPVALTISVKGIPLSTDGLGVYIGGKALTITDVQRSDANSLVSIIHATSDGFEQAGIYDLFVSLEKDGITRKANQAGALVVDQVLSLDYMTPAWGPLSGGTRVTLKGSGFEPGTSVSESIVVSIGGATARDVEVLSSDTLMLTTPRGVSGKSELIVKDRYGNQAVLNAEQGFGYGLALLGETFSDKVKPVDLLIDHATGMAITASGYYTSHKSMTEIEGHLLSSSWLANSFDIQNANQPELAGGAFSIGNGAIQQRHLDRAITSTQLQTKAFNINDASYDLSRLSEAELRTLERNKGHKLPLSADSISVQASRVAGQDLVFTANGAAGVNWLNLNDQNSLQSQGNLYANESKLVSGLFQSGNALFSATYNEFIPEIAPEPCNYLSGQVNAGAVLAANFTAINDPVDVSPGINLRKAGSLYYQKDWLYGQSSGASAVWKPCGIQALDTAKERGNGQADEINAVNLFDPYLSRDWLFDNTVFDLEFYGDYVFVALGNLGIEIFHQERPEQRLRLPLDISLQAQGSNAVGLTRLANLLAVATTTGLVVVDITEPMSPTIVSAGNNEPVLNVDYYNGRLITASGDGGLKSFDLHQVFVAESTLEPATILASNQTITLRFSEAVTLASVIAGVELSETETSLPIAVTIEPLDLQGDASFAFNIQFSRKPLTQYQLVVNNVRSLRGSGQWLAYSVDFSTAAEDELTPVIHSVDNGAYRQYSQSTISINGQDFSASDKLRVFVDMYEVPYVWLSENRLDIPENALSMLPLSIGQHHVKVVNGSQSAQYLGAIVTAEPSEDLQYDISPQAIDLVGGDLIKVTASADAILPGTRIVLEGPDGKLYHTEYTVEGGLITDLEDDVVSLSVFQFRSPGVLNGGVYKVYLSLNDELSFIGTLAYVERSSDLFDLPNVPPHQISSLQEHNNLLFVGISAGAKPSQSNSTLMEHGLEIYDITLPSRPLRLSQLRTEQAVNSLVVVDNLVFLASDSDGLQVVDVTEPTNPLLIESYPVPGFTATGVDYNRNSQVVALSVADPFGKGFVRFFDLNHPRLDPPLGLSNLVFAEGELQGQPVDVKWHKGLLHILLKRDGQLFLVVFTDLERGLFKSQGLEGLSLNNLNASFSLQYGQLIVATDSLVGVYAVNSNNLWEANAWYPSDSKGGAIAVNDGQTLVGNQPGVGELPNPNFVISEVSPKEGATLGSQESIDIYFNQLINTDSSNIDQAVSISLDGNILGKDQYQIVAANRVSGGLVQISDIDTADKSSGVVEIKLNNQLLNLYGSTLSYPVSLQYQLVPLKPVLERVVRIKDGKEFGHYIHGEAGEQLRLEGNYFGEDSNVISVVIGDVVVSNDAISFVDQTSLELELPNLFLGSSTVALPVSIIRNGVADTLNGAVVVMPKIDIQDLNPLQGRPQGGNYVDLYGSGFGSSTQVWFSGVPAANITVANSHRMSVQVPAGDFGYSDVTAANIQFPDDVAQASQPYFYTGISTGSVDLSSDKPSPVSGIVMANQVLYAITGGEYDVYDFSGRLSKKLRTNVARLVVADVSDPVKPVIVEKSFSDLVKPYVFDVDGGLGSKGFETIALSKNDLFIAGGREMYHFDVTLATDPILLNRYELSGNVRDILTDEKLIYVSHSGGVEVFRRENNRTLWSIALIDRTVLSGTPYQLAKYDNSLWIAMTDSRKVIELELASGQYQLVSQFNTTDLSETRFRPEDIVVHGNLILVSSGKGASVVAFDRNRVEGTTAVDSVNLAYLVRNGTVNAGQISLQGQTLYVAAGQGDIQLYDISPWLSGQYSEALPLRHYFSVLGDTTAISVQHRAVYAGSAFPYLNGEPAENPIAEPTQVNHLGGRLSTIENDLLQITQHVPAAEMVWPNTAPIDLQFNRILDRDLLSQFSDSLVELYVDGSKVAGDISHEVFADGSRLRFTPHQELLADKRYQVVVSGAIRDIHGQQLVNDYRFRFVAASGKQPELLDVRPAFGSWRGGDVITVVGENFNDLSRIKIAGELIDPANVTWVNSSELQVLVPGLNKSPNDNISVGITILNESFTSSLNGAFTYIADPVIDALGIWENGGVNVNQHRLIYGDNNWLAIVGRGFSSDTVLKVNGQLAEQVQLFDPNTLLFLQPDYTLGELNLELSNQGFDLDGVSNTDFNVVLQGESRLAEVNGFERHQHLLLSYQHREWKLWSTLESDTPQLLAKGSVNDSIKHVAIANGYIAIAYGDSSPQVDVLELSNPYSPKLVSHYANNENQVFDQIGLWRDVWFGFGNSGAVVSPIYGDVVNQIFWDAAIDARANQNGIYLLYSGQLDFRAIEAINETESFNHSVIAPTQLVMDQQRLLIRSNSELELVEVNGSVSSLGKVLMSQQQVRLSGELLIAKSASPERVVVYDLDNQLSGLTLTKIVEIDNVINTKQWGIQGNVLE